MIILYKNSVNIVTKSVQATFINNIQLIQVVQ